MKNMKVNWNLFFLQMLHGSIAMGGAICAIFYSVYSSVIGFWSFPLVFIFLMVFFFGVFQFFKLWKT